MKQTFLTGIFALIIGTSICAPPPESSTVKFKSMPFNTHWLKGEQEDEFYMYVHLEGIEYTAEESERAPYNLSLVIDKSGSMSGSKIAYTKQAVNYIIDNLDERDVVSLVVYSDGVFVTSEPIEVTNKSLLHKKVDQIAASGSTNLSGGMTKGFKLLENAATTIASDQGYVHRVMLLSDGLANAGITDTPGITSIVKQFYEKNLTISTFGVGADYNENLMAAISTNGGGKYYFIDSPEKLPAIFEEEMNGISNLVAKNLTLEIEYPAELAQFEDVRLYPYAHEPGKIKIRLADLFAKEQKAILVKFKIDPNAYGDVDFITTIKYNNPFKDGEEYIEKHEHAVEITENKSDYRNGFTLEANMGYALMVGGEYFDQAMTAADSRNFSEAEKELEKAKEIMEKHFSLFKPHPFLKEFYKEMEDYEQTLKKLQKTKNSRTFSLIQKRSKHRSFRAISCPSF